MELLPLPFSHPRLTMKSTCSSCPVADVICRTVELGLTIEGAFIGEGDITVIRARPIEVLPFSPACGARSEEHTSELQSRFDIVCRLLLEKKKNLMMRRTQCLALRYATEKPTLFRAALIASLCTRKLTQD